MAYNREEIDEDFALIDFVRHGDYNFYFNSVFVLNAVCIMLKRNRKMDDNFDRPS